MGRDSPVPSRPLLPLGVGILALYLCQVPGDRGIVGRVQRRAQERNLLLDVPVPPHRVHLLTCACMHAPNHVCMYAPTYVCMHLFMAAEGDLRLDTHVYIHEYHTNTHTQTDTLD